VAVPYCPRCGYRGEGFVAFDPRFCVTCFDGVADDARAREIAEAAGAGSYDARRLLSEIADERAVDALVDALGHDDADVRRAAIESLGHVGDVRAVPAAVEQLRDEHERVRRSALESLAQLGSTAAADALAECLHDDELHVDAASGLAWLRDPRAFEPLVRLLPPPWPELAHSLPTGLRAFGALGWLGDRAAVPHLVDSLQQLAEEGERWKVMGVSEAVARALLQLGGPEAEEAVADARERLATSAWAWPLMPHHYARRAFTYPEADEQRRTVAKRSLELTPADVPVRDPITKFGGQPVWLDEPTWPLTRAGTPMTFFAQFLLPEPGPRLAYLFVDVEGGTQRSDEGDACVFVQPGPRPEAFERCREGPTYVSDKGAAPPAFVHRSRRGLIESLPTLVEGRDPPAWDETWLEEPDSDFDWNKLGGTPRFLQAEEWPEGEGWAFLAQFTAGYVGHEFGDVAECYVFVADDGRGAFFWQCH
jgi:hypothetical protein